MSDASCAQVFIAQFPWAKELPCIAGVEDLSKVFSLQLLSEVLSSKHAPNQELIPQLNHYNTRSDGVENS